jgi:arylsulfatase A-like enzyme
MSRLVGLLSCLLLLSTVASPRAMAADAPRPNIVFLLADDLGSYDVGWRGGEIKTPHLDQLAREGARLEQFYVQPVCSPTRAALMTGRYPLRYGLQVGVVRPWAQYGLPLEERMLPQVLHDAGYETAIVGKWHLGHYQREYLPTRRGFDHQYGHYNGALDYFTHVRDEGFDWHRDDQENHDEGYTTHLLADEAVRRINQRDRTKPLFLYVPFNAVHSPHQAPPSYSQPYARFAGDRRVYAGMLAAMDEAIGKVLAAIDKQGLRENTLLVFSSDNGGPRPGVITSNGPLRAGKGTVYEGGVRVAALAAWKGRIQPGSSVNTPLHIVDWYPTLIKLAGGSLEQPLPIDGRDLLPALTGGALVRAEPLVLNISPRGGALRHHDWKLVVNGDVTAADGEDGDDARPAGGQPRARLELFDLAHDTAEEHNLADKHPQVVADLLTRYEGLSKQAAAPKARAKPRGFQSPRVWGQSN